MPETIREEDELKQIFDELKGEHDIESMVEFSDIDIMDKLKQNEYMIIKYKELYYNELSKYEILERKMEALVGMRYKYYKFEDDQEWDKKEIEKYCLPRDKKIITMKKLMAKQQIRVRFFDMCWRAFDKMAWSMKTFSDRERMGL